MAFFQWRPTLESALPPFTREIRRVYGELEQSQWFRPAEIEKLQLDLLRPLVEHCRREIPYYQRLFKDAGIPDRPLESLAEFGQLPRLTRELYQANFDELQAKQLPSGTVDVGSDYSSGTTGVPVKIFKTNRTALIWYALTLRDLEWSGFDPRGRIAAIRHFDKDTNELFDGVVHSRWDPRLDPLFVSGKLAAMDVRQDPRRQLEWLRETDPDYLLSMPSNLEFLAGLCADSGKRLPNLKIIEALGETLDDPTRKRIETGFGAVVKNLYSSTEAGYIASTCPTGLGLHVHCENVLVEVLDAEDRPCLPGQKGRLVITTLHNYRTPFLRYEIGDDVTLASRPCLCGRVLPLLTRVDGRRHPLLILPDGRRKVVTGLVVGIRVVGGAHQFQIIQRKVDHVVIRVVPDRTWTSAHAERIRQCVQAEFSTPIRVDVEEKERIEPTPRGKVKVVLIEAEGTKPPAEKSAP